MIIVTGGAGFIGSSLIWKLNKEGINDIIIVDRLGNNEKYKNLINLKFFDYIDVAYNDNYKDKFIGINNFLDKLNNNYFGKVQTIFHIGACSSTTENDCSYLIRNNYEFSKKISKISIDKNIDFFYASSAATYGDGKKGYNDNRIFDLSPMNMYGYSKQLFDVYSINNNYFSLESKFIGMKFFNVFGPNEYHKGPMRSLVLKAYYDVLDKGYINLFKSYKKEYSDGDQKRDFVYIKDVVNIIFEMYINNIPNGIYNIGTGKARSWNDVALALFKAIGKEPNINYIDMPDILKEKYQYFTEADMNKTLNCFTDYKFYSLEDAIFDYVNNYIAPNKYLGEE